MKHGACGYKFHFGDEGHGPFFAVADKRDGDLCVVCGLPWNKQRHRCSGASCQWAAYQARYRQGPPFDDWWKTDYQPPAPPAAESDSESPAAESDSESL